MEFATHQFQTIKLGLHVAQVLFIFVSWAIEIAVFKASTSKVDGRAGWNFGLCFLTIPAIIYLTMTQRFARTRRLANPYAMAAVDGIFCILWLSGFAAVANWNASGECGNGCKLSKVVVGLDVFVWLLFIVTTAMSVYGCIYYRREGYLPGASRAPTNAQLIDPDKEAFSTAPHDDEYVPVHSNDDHDDHDIAASGQGSHLGDDRLGGQVHYETPAPSYGGYMPPSVGEDTSYMGYTGVQGQSPVVGENGRVQFPAGRYDHV